MMLHRLPTVVDCGNLGVQRIVSLCRNSELMAEVLVNALIAEIDLGGSPAFKYLFLVDEMGFEPTTSSLRTVGEIS